MGCKGCQDAAAAAPIVVRVEHRPQMTIGGLLFAVALGAAGVVGAKLAMLKLLEPVG